MMNVLVDQKRRISIAYAAAEVLWYLAGENDITRLVSYAPQYKNFADGKVAYGAYGARWFANPGWVRSAPVSHEGMSQLSGVIEALKRHPTSRQAVITMWDSSDLHRAIELDCKDLPCTLSMQFLLREEQLHCVVNMRSNDVWLGTPYDIFAFTCVQRIVADELGVRVGSYTHSVGSLHVYSKHVVQARAIIGKSTAMVGYDSPTYAAPSLLNQVPLACQIETAMRTGKALPKMCGINEGSLFADLISTLGLHHRPMRGQAAGIRHEGIRLLTERNIERCALASKNT